MKFGVDAYNLAADRRGMGRLVRQTLRSLERLGQEIVLVVRSTNDAQRLREEFPYRTVTPKDLAGERLRAVWYPWNGMRFAPHAYAIVTIHDPFAFTYPHRNPIARMREQAPIRSALKNADRIFAISHWTEGELKRLFRLRDDFVRVVPNVPDEYWRPAEAPQDTPYMLFLAGPERRKNAPMLFRAFDAALGGDDVQLVVTGELDPVAQRELDRMRAAHRHLETDDERLRTAYSGALAVLVPSLAEGFGLPAVEAMACGAPVIAADAAALPETCGGAALLVPPGDEDAWREALQRIAHDGALRAELRTRGFDRVRNLDRDAPAKALIAEAG